jgi:hypothetical protein
LRYTFCLANNLNTFLVYFYFFFKCSKIVMSFCFFGIFFCWVLELGYLGYA